MALTMKYIGTTIPALRNNNTYQNSIKLRKPW
jgi:hypothetical protein